MRHLVRKRSSVFHELSLRDICCCPWICCAILMISWMCLLFFCVECDPLSYVFCVGCCPFSFMSNIINLRLSFCLCHEFSLQKSAFPTLIVQSWANVTKLPSMPQIWSRRRRSAPSWKKAPDFKARADNDTGWTSYLIIRAIGYSGTWLQTPQALAIAFLSIGEDVFFHVRAFVFLHVCVSLSVEIPFVVFAVSGVTFASICLHFCCMLRIGYFFAAIWCHILPFVAICCHIFFPGYTHLQASLEKSNVETQRPRRRWCAMETHGGQRTADSDAEHLAVLRRQRRQVRFQVGRERI